MLEPYCPPGTELDLLGGEAHISLVAFDFLHTRVRGVAWPGFVNFTEINLRFYARSGERRGVVFIREYVPKRFVAWLARRLYNEPYRPAPMRSKVVQANGAISASHLLKTSSGNQALKIVAHRTPSVPPPGSVEHHFKEHQWGFGVDRQGRPLTYEVRHPQWQIFPISSYELHWNWSDVYGPEWSFLQDQTPVSVILAAGSEVAVYPQSPDSTPPTP